MSWWRRLLPRRRRDKLAAGSRPWKADGNGSKGKRKRKRSGGASPVIVMARRGLGVVLLVFGLAYGFHDGFRGWVDERRVATTDWVMGIIRPEFDPVTVGPGTTTNVVPEHDPDHPARFATDGFTNTHWLAPVPTDVLRPELDLTLTDTVDLAKVIVHNGASDDFQASHRPKTLLFIYDNGEQHEIELDNTPDSQEIDLDNGGGVRRLKVVITSIYESIDGDVVALSEIEFFKRS